MMGLKRLYKKNEAFPRKLNVRDEKARWERKLAKTSFVPFPPYIYYWIYFQT